MNAYLIQIILINLSLINVIYHYFSCYSYFIFDLISIKVICLILNFLFSFKLRYEVDHVSTAITFSSAISNARVIKRAKEKKIGVGVPKAQF